jgi:pyruvate dehydrogenase E2 component (dihydrolipoamide acetyltransferase)
MLIEVFMPKLGQTMEEGRIIAWRKREGEAVRKGEVLLEVETDKANLEVEAAADGYLRKVLVKEDARVPVFTLLAFIGDMSDPLPVESGQGLPAEPGKAAVAATVEAAVTKEEAGAVRASPRARKLAEEKGVDVHQLKGSGPGGRVQEKDVLAFLEARTPSAVRPRVEPLSRLRKVMGQHLQQSVQTAPHFYVTIDADVTALMQIHARLSRAAKEGKGPRVTVNDFLIKAIALSLAEFPQVNCQLEGADQVRVNEFINVGIALPVEGGLLVPVVSEAHRKTLVEIADISRRAIEEAKAGRMTATPASITISNLGMYGVREFTAIINPPEAAILAVGAVRPVLAVKEDSRSFGVTQAMSITMSSDHRLIDGALAARFLASIREKLENVQTWLDAGLLQA